MSLSATQLDELRKPLDKQFVSSRIQSGRALSYVEGWHVISEANRIFGFDGWQRETIEMREVRAPEQVQSSNGKKTWRVGFICKVRVTVGNIVREGTGYGSGALPDLGEAYESAVKEAETDAMKRALMTFGNPFGLALYDKSLASVASSEEAQEKPKAKSSGPTVISSAQATYSRLSKANSTCTDIIAFNRLWTHKATDQALASLTDDLKATIRKERDEKQAELKAAAAPADDPFPGDLPMNGREPAAASGD
jgi:DNA repair and recombination protein RAD52